MARTGPPARPGELGIHQLEEGAPRVERRDDHSRLQLRPIGEGHAGRPAIVGQHPLDPRIQPDLGPERRRGPCQDLRESAVAALVEGPRPELAIGLAEGVVEEHEPRPL